MLFSPEVLDAFIAGDRAAALSWTDFAIPDAFPGGALELLTFRREQLRAEPARLPWLLRALVIREARREMVGFANFHGPPGVNDLGLPGAAEIGYEVFPEHRGRGYATEAARAMIEWARRERGVRHFLSGIRPDNAPSLRVIEKIGFQRRAEVVDGELIFELRVT